MHVTAIELLEAQHKELRELLREIESSNHPDDRQALFEELADRLAIHLTIEETHLRRAVSSADEDDERPLDAFERHIEIGRTLAEIIDLGVEDPTFDAALRVLGDRVEAHIQSDAARLFPDARRLLNPRELSAIGERMVWTQFELEAEPPRAGMFRGMTPLD